MLEWVSEMDRNRVRIEIGMGVRNETGITVRFDRNNQMRQIFLKHVIFL
jgi:hypothetical protein